MSQILTLKTSQMIDKQSSCSGGLIRPPPNIEIVDVGKFTDHPIVGKLCNNGWGSATWEYFRWSVAWSNVRHYCFLQ